MRKFFRYAAYSVLILIGMPCSGIGAYYLFHFLPYQYATQRIIATTDLAHRNPPHAAYQLALIAEGKWGIRSWTARNLLREYSLDKNQRRYWNVNYFAWTYLIGFHYSEQELFTLWCHYYWNLHQQAMVSGLSRASQTIYKKPLSALHLEELARLIASLRSPPHYQRHPEVLQKRVSRLLERYKFFSSQISSDAQAAEMKNQLAK